MYERSVSLQTVDRIISPSQLGESFGISQTRSCKLRPAHMHKTITYSATENRLQTNRIERIYVTLSIDKEENILPAQCWHDNSFARG